MNRSWVIQAGNSYVKEYDSNYSPRFRWANNLSEALKFSSLGDLLTWYGRTMIVESKSNPSTIHIALASWPSGWSFVEVEMTKPEWQIVPNTEPRR